MRTRLIALPLMLVLTTVPSAIAAQTVDEQALIRRVKRTPVSSLGVKSKDTVDRWIARVVARPVTWEVNDCGEGGDGNSAPACVEVASERLGFVLRLLVLDLEGRPGPPELFYGSIRLRNGVEQDFKQLADLPKLMEQAATSRP